MARELYNFIWTLPDDVIAHRGATLVNGRGVTGRRRVWSRAVIVFPNLMSPLVHVPDEQDPWLELLIIASMELTRHMVNRQLRISAGLDPRKRHARQSLFGGVHGRVEVNNIGLIDQRGRTRISTHSRFKGILEARIAQELARSGFNQVHQVRIHESGLPIRNELDPRDYSAQHRVLMHYGYRTARGRAVGVSEPGRVGLEDSDHIVRTALDRLQPNSPIAGRGLYAFKPQGNTIDPMWADKEEPIQSYHPLFVFTDDDRFSYANLGHVSDIHINTRLQLLGKTPARVIEYGDGVHMDESPPISSLLQETNRSFSEVLRRLLATNADALIVGGDLIDHFKNAYSLLLSRPSDRPPTAADIWHDVDMDNNYSAQSYPIGVDMIAFYSFVIRAMRQSQKPMFAITGNHDAYLDAYGISPRVYGQRPNEGIPADVNLTFYEALLAFGPSAANVENTSNFTPRMLKWFYTVFTPFKDFSLKLPKQELVCLGWGEQEDLIGLVGDTGQGFSGHLPRSDDGVSSTQLSLLQASIADRHRDTILCTHFTVASYADSIPMYEGSSPGREGTLERGEFGRFDMGTFESGRDEVLGHLEAGEVQVVLTGHSHRRGVYLLDERRQWPLKIRMYDPHPTRGFDVATRPRGLRPVPVIVVSDSSGPYPKHNRSGEFMGWAPDKPAGTLVQFDNTGAVRQIRAIRANGRAKPRAAVGIDYLDQIERKALGSTGIRSVPFSSRDHNRGVSSRTLYRIEFPLHRVLWDYMSVFVTKLVFAGRRRGGSWVRVEATTWNAADKTWDIAPADNASFREFVRSAVHERYLVVYTGTNNRYLSARFDWAQPWVFEIAVRPILLGAGYSQTYLQITRPGLRAPEAYGPNLVYADIPNWDYRRAHGGPKYQTSS